jgi:hypothetical protein
MNRTNSFPLPFKSLRTLSGGKEGTYVIGAMFTAAYFEKAERLVASCEKFELPYVIHEVPTVHRSFGIRGTDDLTYTKPNFIRHLLATHKKPILYMDADCEFISRPELIDQLAKSVCDFAIYNKYADVHTDWFIPIELSHWANEPQIEKRFYRYLGSGRLYTNSQLGCYGCVQFYRNSVAARALLSKWQKTLAEFPGRGDDACLNFTFNNLTKLSWLPWLLKVQWLPSSYARLPFFIFTEPVINHPDIPGDYAKFSPFKDPKGRKQFYKSLAEWKDAISIFPEDCIIDTEQKMLCRLVDDQLVPLKPTDRKLWL